jgi:hypothetical protein
MPAITNTSPISPQLGPDTKGVRNFWLTCLQNHPELSELITEDDEEALHHLIDVRFVYLEDDVVRVYPGYFKSLV